MVSGGQVVRFLVPGVAISLTGWVTSASCGPVRGGEHISFRPPPWVFAIVWPILYITTGLVWAASGGPLHIDLIFGAIVLLCCAWLPVYSCAKAKRVSAALLCAAAFLSWVSIFVVPARWAMWVSVPLALWTSFATILNFAEIGTQSS